ncbi:MAG: SPOR domain-containing protein [Pseudomonadota bacterium]
MSDSGEIKHDSVAQDDPFAELLRLTEEATSEVEDTSDTGFYAENQQVEVQSFVMPLVEEASAAVAVEMPADLEQALLAELGVDPAAATEPDSPVSDEADLVLPEPDMGDVTAQAPDLTLAEAFNEALPEQTFEDPATPSLEDELEALLGNQQGVNTDQAPTAAQIDDQAPVIEEVPLSEQEARVLMETALADEGLAQNFNTDQSLLDPGGSIYTEPQLDLPDDDQIDLEEAIAAEIEQISSADEKPLTEAAPQESLVTSEVDDLDIDALFENALAGENIFDDVPDETQQTANDASEMQADDELETDPLDELLGIMGDEPLEAPVEQPFEQEFSGAPEALAMAPTLQTQEINLEEDLDLSDFDLPIEGDFDKVDVGRGYEEGGDGSVVVGALAAAQAGSVHANADQGLDLTLDDAFDEVRFEAELARDMEFVAHDAQARTNTDFDDLAHEMEADLEMPELEAVPEEKNQRGLKIAAIVGSIAVAGALGLFLFAGGTGDDSAGPVIVEADPEPIKVRPENPGGTEVPNQDSAVFAGNDGAQAPSQPSLVATSQEPVDLAGLPTTEQPKSEERLLPDIPTDVGTTVETEDGSITPRRVRTLVVRPDGTLEERPIEEPPVEVAATEPPATEPVDNSAPQVVAPPAVEPPASTETGVVFQPPAPDASAQEGEVPVRRVQTQVFSPNGIPSRPVDQPVNVVNDEPAPQQVAAAPAAVPTPAETSVATETAALSGGDFKVQIASLPTQVAAQQTSANLLSQFRSVLGGRGVSIRAAQIPDRGTFYRVQVDASSLEDANSLCSRYKAAGGDCIVTR